MKLLNLFLSFLILFESIVIADDTIGKFVRPKNVIAIDSPADNEILSYDSETGKFEWVAGGGGDVTGTTVTVQISDSSLVDITFTIDFGSGFDGTESPTGEANITIDLSEIVTGDIEFSTNVANVIKIQDVTISTDTPSSGQVLTATGANTADWQSASGGGKSFSVDTDGNLEKGLVAYWNFNEASLNRFDSVAGAHLQDVATVTTTTGKVGDAAAFFTRANSEQFKSIAYESIQQTDTQFSMAGWFLLTTTANDMGIISQWSGAGNRSFIMYHYGTGNRIYFGVSANGTAEVNVQASTFGAPSINTWYFFYVYHDSIANTIGISINNGSANTTAHTTGVFHSFTNFEVGAYGTGKAFLDGALDEIGFWRRILTAQEITDLYNGGTGQTYS